MSFMPLINESSKKNYHILVDYLNRISYKPGWAISINEEQNNYGFVVTVTYEGYESENCIDTPLSGGNKQATVVAARLLGKTFQKPEKRYFRRRFDMLNLDTIAPEHIIRYVISDTIMQAELFEFNRWFKVEGLRVFGECNE